MIFQSDTYTTVSRCPLMIFTWIVYGSFPIPIILISTFRLDLMLLSDVCKMVYIMGLRAAFRGSTNMAIHTVTWGGIVIPILATNMAAVTGAQHTKLLTMITRDFIKTLQLIFWPVCFAEIVYVTIILYLCVKNK